VAHHAAGTPSCERRSTIGNGLPSGGLAARQDLGRRGGKQGKRDSAVEVPNTGEVSRVRARGRVCVRAWARSFGQDGVRMIKGGHQLGMVLAHPGRKVALGGGDRVQCDEVWRRRRVLGVCTGVLAHSHVCVRAQDKQIGKGSAPPPGACVLVRGGLVRKTEIWPDGGVHGPVCASDESWREQRPRWRGTA
jgi:hypothetical protein